MLFHENMAVLHAQREEKGGSVTHYTGTAAQAPAGLSTGQTLAQHQKGYSNWKVR